MKSNRTDEDKQQSSEEQQGLRLLALLLQCAEYIAVDNLSDATDLLLEATELSSPFGSPPERVAAYFAEALRALIVSSCTGTFHSSSSLRPPSLYLKTQGFHSAFRSYNAIAPMIKFSHFTANQAMYDALQGEERVHVIDLDIMQGLQWPGLFHILASRPSPKLLSLRLTGIGPNLGLLDQTGCRLAEFAGSLGLPFEFKAVEGRIGEIRDDDVDGVLGLRAGEARVVQWMQHSLYDVTGSHDGTLKALATMKPRLVTLIEQDQTMGSSSFSGRFVEALHYYSALFDALEEGIGGGGGDDLEEEWRHEVERVLLGWEIRNIISSSSSSTVINNNYTRWGEELLRAGFRHFSLGGGPAAQAQLLLGMTAAKRGGRRGEGGYRLLLDENNGWLRLGWKDLSLLTASAWQWHPLPTQ
ncbi:hypothetical protein Droror1_Dr00010635 [Drosera rotundifolia]